MVVWEEHHVFVIAVNIHQTLLSPAQVYLPMVLWFCVVLQFCFSLLSPVCPSFFLTLLNAKKYHVPLYQSVSKGGPTVIKSAADSPATSWLSIKGQLLLLHSPEELMFFALWSIKVSISPAVVGPFTPRVRDLSGVLDFIRVEGMRLMDCSMDPHQPTQVWCHSVLGL